MTPLNRAEPGRPCVSGCPNLRGACPLHSSRPFASVRRPSSSTAQGYGARHREWRAAVLAIHPVCQHLGGCNRASTEAHHIIPIRRGGARYDLANGVGLCHRHHSAVTGRETRR